MAPLTALFVRPYLCYSLFRLSLPGVTTNNGACTESIGAGPEQTQVVMSFQYPIRECFSADTAECRRST
jgi:hypothetical protein